MSLPEFDTQSFLFSTAALSGSLFPEDDRYRLFATLVYPRLVKARSQLAACYSEDNGRVAVEPVVLLGISVLQFVDGLPDRAAVEMLRYHAGWNFALNRQLGDRLFHPTTLVNFRQRLLSGVRIEYFLEQWQERRQARGADLPAGPARAEGGRLGDSSALLTSLPNPTHSVAL